MTIAGLLADGTQRLEKALLPRDPHATPALDAEVLLAYSLGVSRTRLRSHPEESPGADPAARFRVLIERRAAGEPVAYIIERKGFWSLELRVTPAVLVPRPETELLV
ncbi:MAG: peptide chain release factor N(5)-glutamine methyltransferase, partial [Steroidobacteraceae bacterium]